MRGGIGKSEQRVEVRVQPEMKCLITSSRGGTGNRWGGQRLREEVSPFENQHSSDARKVGRLLAKHSAENVPF